MTIVALETYELTPREDLLYSIMEALIEAMNSDEPVGVGEVAESIMALVEESPLIA